MIALARRVWTVADLMRRQRLDLAGLQVLTGLDSNVLAAVFHQRYTPSPDQCRRISAALRVDRKQIVWGHAAAVDHNIRLFP